MLERGSELSELIFCIWNVDRIFKTLKWQTCLLTTHHHGFIELALISVNKASWRDWLSSAAICASFYMYKIFLMLFFTSKLCALFLQYHKMKVEEPANSEPSCSMHQGNLASTWGQFCKKQWLLECCQNPGNKTILHKVTMTYSMSSKYSPYKYATHAKCLPAYFT